MNRDEKFIRLAIDIAKESEMVVGSRHCAIITKGKKIISIGVNSKTSHTEMFSNKDQNKIFLHAEIQCLLGVRYRDINGYTMYIGRYSSAGNNISKPCPKCMSSIKTRGIKKIVYTTDEGYIIEKVGSNGPSKVKSVINLDWNYEYSNGRKGIPAQDM